MLLMFNTEALLLINDHKAKILEANITAEQPMGADHDIDRSVDDALNDLLRLLVGLEPR